MKEINLIPEYAAFDYKKFITVKISTFFIVLNIVVLVAISLINIYINNSLTNRLHKKRVYLNKVVNINNRFDVYKKQYIDLKKKLIKLKSDIAYYKSLVVMHRSAYTDSIVFLNTFFDDVWFSSVSYRNGHFDVNGFANSKDKFQQFYSGLANNKYITNLRFFYIKKEDDKYIFRVNYRIVFKW